MGVPSAANVSVAYFLQNKTESYHLYQLRLFKLRPGPADMLQGQQLYDEAHHRLQQESNQQGPQRNNTRCISPLDRKFLYSLVIILCETLSKQTGNVQHHNITALG